MNPARNANLHPRPLGSKNKPIEKRKRPVYITGIKTFLAAIAKSTGITRKKIIEETGLSPLSTQTYLLTMNTGVDRFIYIDRYIRFRGSGQWSAVYKFGINVPNTPAPRWLTSTEKKAGLCNWIKVFTNEGHHYEYTGNLIPRERINEFSRDERASASSRDG